MNKRSEAAKKRWQNPEYRAKQRAGIRRSWRNPDRQQRQKEALKAHWDQHYWDKVENFHHKYAKLTEDQVKKILDDKRSDAEIAKEYRISYGHVRDIKARKYWKFPEDEDDIL